MATDTTTEAGGVGPVTATQRRLPRLPDVLSWLSRMRRTRRVQTLGTLGLVLLGPLLAFATFVVLGPLDQNTSSTALRLVLLADLVYILVIAALVLARVARLVAARRAQSAGSRLHLRLTGVFAVMALIPTITVAVFAMLSVNMGLEAWFSDRVRDVVAASQAAAVSYEDDQRLGLEADAVALSGFVSIQRGALGPRLFEDRARQILSQGQAQIQRGLREAFLIDAQGEIVARGERSYLFDYERPTAAEIARADEGAPVLMRDWDNNEFRALVPIRGYADHYLYVTRIVDGALLQLLDETEKTAQFYEQKESERGRVLFDFALLYLGFAVLLILAAVWLGLWFAERLSRPVGRLTGAAQQVGAGNLDVRVFEEEGDDEIALLSRYFNQMTRQLKGQRQALLDNTDQIERRRRLFDSVLSSVTSGVVGLDAEGRMTFVNRSAQGLLDGADIQRSVDLPLAVPEFGALFDTLRAGSAKMVQGEIKVSRGGKMENLLVRMSRRIGVDGKNEGYVVAFDDVTDLVSAQRMAAWGDVARRIAHEIKNPLTPIQLSAERIKRKFASRLGEDSDQLEQMTDVIVRQTNDLRRIVDEFSKFARMPEPVLKDHDLAELLRAASMLQESGQPNVRFDVFIPSVPVMAEVDDTMITQAFTNLMKNAGEATETYQENATGAFVPSIHVTMDVVGEHVQITIADNGIGLPEDRARLFEPYVTTRDKGTGLGLPIVKKIVEEHGGTLVLDDASVFDGCSHRGAAAIIQLPLAKPAETRLERQ